LLFGLVFVPVLQNHPGGPIPKKDTPCAFCQHALFTSAQEPRSI
jgi:hypothetical protein